jgi:plasmid stabilization system protein ParE
LNYNIIKNIRFEKDLEYIVYFYYSKGNFKYADKLTNKVNEIILSLLFFPKKFALIPEANDKEIRHFICDRFRILYRIDGKNIYILAMIGSNIFI